MTKKLPKDISKLMLSFRKNLNELGMVDKSIDMLLEGKPIIDCFYCKTPNMYEIYNTGPVEHGHSMYECGNCQKTWMEKEGKW